MNFKRIGPALALSASLVAAAACSPESEPNAAVPFSDMECVEPQQVDTAELMAIGGTAISQVDQLTDPNLRAASVIFVRQGISALTGLPLETIFGSGFIAEGDETTAIVTSSEILESQVKSEESAIYVPKLGWLKLSGCALRDAAVPLQKLDEEEISDKKEFVPVAIQLPESVQKEISIAASRGEITPYTIYELENGPDNNGAEIEENINPIIPVYTKGIFQQAAIVRGGLSDDYPDYFGVTTIVDGKGLTGDLCSEVLGAPVLPAREMTASTAEVYTNPRSNHLGYTVWAAVVYVSLHTTTKLCGDEVGARTFDEKLIEEAGLLVGSNG